MRGGVNAIMFTAALATAGCVTDSDKLQIRPLADAFTKATKAGSPTVAEGRGLLAVGSVGLAIEAFRKALREQPNSIEALAGLAECYDQMGRHDLSQAKYEAALAIAPEDPTLLRTFAASLERQGRFGEATELRAEADNAAKAEAAALAPLAPAASIPVQAQAAPPAARTAIPAPQSRPVPVKVAAAPAVQEPASVKMAVAQPPKVVASQAKPLQAPAAAELEERTAAPPKSLDVQLKSASLVSRTAWAIDAAPIAPPPVEASATVTLKLPPPTQPRVEAPTLTAAVPARIDAPKVAAAATPPRVEPTKVATAQPANVATGAPLSSEAPKVASAPAAVRQPAKTVVASAPSITVRLPPASPAVVLPREKPIAPIRQIVADAIPASAGPRLERLSLAEVALITDPRPRWRSQTAPQLAIGAPPRFVPLAELQHGYGVRLLNAARHEGLAARTRVALNQRGWKSVTIGDSARVRQHSLVLYSEANEQAARRLATHFGFWIAREARPGPLTVLLGRDWVTRSHARA